MDSRSGGSPVHRRPALIALAVSLVLGCALILVLFLSGRRAGTPERAPEAPGVAAVGAAAPGAGPAEEKKTAGEEKAGKEEEDAGEDGPPLLRGKVTGDGTGIAGAKVSLFATSRIIESLERLEKVAPESGDLPDINAIVAGAKKELEALRSSSSTATTRDDGTYEFRKLVPGGHLVLTVADGWLFRYGDVVSIERGRTEVLDIALEHGARIAGRVVDARGDGVKGAIVTAEFRPGGMAGVGPMIRRLIAYLNGEFLRGPFQTAAAEDGSFAFASLPPGLYDIAAGLPGGVEARTKGIESGNEEVLIYLGPPGWITGAFIRPGGAPVAGVKSRLERVEDMVQLPAILAGFNDLANSINRLIGDPPRTKESGKRGDFRFGPLAPGKFKLAVEASGFLAFNRTLDLEWGQVLDLGVLTLDPGESIEGTVRSADGQPLAGAKVLSTPSTMNFMNMGPAINDYLSFRSVAATDAAGKFRLAGLHPAKYRLTATAAGFVPAAKKSVPTGGDPVEFVLERGLQVTGTVVAAEGGEPIAGARVECGLSRTRTGDDGSFVLDGVVPEDPSLNPFDFNAGMAGRAGKKAEEAEKKTVRVKAQAAGFLDASESVDLDSKSPEVTIEMDPVPEVRGIVFDPDDKPAPGSLVRLTPDIPDIPFLDFLDPTLIFLGVGVSDLEGRFKFTGLKGINGNAKYKVVADHVLHARGSSTAFSFADGDPGDVEVRLARGARVKGVVTDGRAPIAGAAVRLRKKPPAAGGPGAQQMQQAQFFVNMLGLPKGGQTTYAGHDGNFDYGKVLPGEYAVAAEMSGYIEAPEQAFALAAGEEKTVEIVLDPGKEIAGTVVDGTGAAIDGARVRLLAKPAEGVDQGLIMAQRMFGGATKSAKSGEDGGFRLTGLAAGSYTIIVEKAGFMTFERADVNAGDKPLKVVILPSATLRGTVTDAATGAPIRRFRVGVRKSGEPSGPGDFFAAMGPEVNDPEGRFARDDLEGGAYTVTVSATGWTKAQADVTLTPGVVTEQNLSLAQAGRVRGVVVTRERGEPVAGVRISYLRGERTERAEATEKGRKADKTEKVPKPAETDPKVEDMRAMGEVFGREWLQEATATGDDGSFLLEGVPEGPQTIVASHPNFIIAFTDDVEVGLGQEVDLTFRLDSGLSVSGKVVDASGSPIANRWALLRGAGDDNSRIRKTVTSNQDGEFKVSGLEKGKYRLVVPGGGAGKPGPEAIEIDLKADQEGILVKVPEAR